MGKLVWITGASSGIGEALARQYAVAGDRVIISARRKEKLEEIRTSLMASFSEAKVFVLPLDICDPMMISSVVDQVTIEFGSVDLLINNAGISQRSLCMDTDMDTYRRLFEVDVFGQIALTKAILPHMLTRGSGHIAVTSSVTGKVGVPLRTGYSAAKHALMGFFDSLRAEIAHRGIHVTTITPGFIRTAVSENALKGDGTNFGAMDSDIAGGMDPDDCAREIFKGLEKRKPEIAVGQGKEMHILWIKRYFPNLAFKLAARLGAASQIKSEVGS